LISYGIDKGDTFLASSGDNGNGGAAKQHKESTVLSTTAVGFPGRHRFRNCFD
jgi:hypothetical protein